MKNIKYITLLLLFLSNVCHAQTFTVASDTLSGSAFQCYLPANAWEGDSSYGSLLNYVAFPATPTRINWTVVASNFPADWIPNFLIQDSAGYHYNSSMTLWNGSTGSTQRVSYPATGSLFYFILYETALTTSGTYWLEVNLKDSTSAYNHNIWFVFTRNPGSLGDSISGPVNVCPGASITLLDTIAVNGLWKASNGNATLTDSFVTGVTGGLDTITYSGYVYVYSGTDTCSFHPIITKVISVYAAPSPTVSATASSELYIPAVYSSYQWLFSSSPIAGANGPTYIPTINGMYAVTVTDGNGCVGTSPPFFEEYLSVASLGPAAGIRIFPNPASSVVNIQAAIPVSVRIISLAGNVLIPWRPADHIDISSLPDDDYIVEIASTTTGQQITSAKITKIGSK